MNQVLTDKQTYFENHHDYLALLLVLLFLFFFFANVASFVFMSEFFTSLRVLSLHQVCHS